MNNRTFRPDARLRYVGLLFAFCLGLGASLSAQVVTNTADSGPGSLRLAISNAVSGATITFATNFSGQTITLGSELLVSNKNLTIDASGLPNGLAISGSNVSRIFEFSSGTTNVLVRLTLTNGFLPTDVGGAIFNQGRLTLSNSTLAGNFAGYGGALFNDSSATLTLNNCTIARNTTANEAGAFYNRGVATVNNCTIVSNVSLAYGGIYNDSPATLTLDNCIVGGNTGTSGADVHNRGALTLGGANLLQTTIVSGGGSISGSPIIGPPLVAPLGNYGGPTQTMPPLPGSPAIDAGDDSITNSLTTDQRGLPRLVGAHVDIGAVELQAAEPFYNPVQTTADSGPYSLRCAIAGVPAGSTITFNPNLSGQTIVLGDQLLVSNKNLTIDASGLAAGLSISGGNVSRIFEFSSGTTNVLVRLTLANGFLSTDVGAAILNQGRLTVSDSTLAGNFAGYGGALFNDSSATLTLNNCTIARNTAANEAGAFYNRGLATLNQCTIVSNVSTAYGGIYNDSPATLTLDNCIVGGNFGASGADVHNRGALTLAGTNLLQTTIAVGGGSISGSPIIGPPLVAPLGNYGGPTQTMPPLPGSPAIDAGGPTTLVTDQRGLPRLVGAHVDIGAVELQAAEPFYNPVQTTADSGPYSLRGAIAGVPAGSTIAFNPNLSGQTITLGSELLVSNKNLTIDASGLPNGLAISGNLVSRIFEFSSGTTNVLVRLTLTNGFLLTDVGAAILNQGRLTLSNCTLSGNSAGNGGGIFNFLGTLTLNNSTLAGNSAYTEGGGIYNIFLGTLTLNNCTLAGNFAGYGGALFNDSSATLTLNNCTIARNTATNEAGAFYNRGMATLNNCTIVSNVSLAYGGIYDDNGATLTLDNCIVGGNSGANGADVHNRGALTLGGANLLQTTIVGGGSISGSPIIGPPLVAPLGNYGGPTQTMPPLPGSPAVDAGGPTTLVTDQRGLPRLSGDQVDIGAVELQLITANTPSQIAGLTKLCNGAFQFSFTNDTGASFRILATTNVALPASNWTFIGFATEVPANSGQFQFTDPQATNIPQRFYRVKSP